MSKIILALVRILLKQVEGYHIHRDPKRKQKEGANE